MEYLYISLIVTVFLNYNTNAQIQANRDRIKELESKRIEVVETTEANKKYEIHFN